MCIICECIANQYPICLNVNSYCTETKQNTTIYHFTSQFELPLPAIGDKRDELFALVITFNVESSSEPVLPVADSSALGIEFYFKSYFQSVLPVTNSSALVTAFYFKPSLELTLPMAVGSFGHSNSWVSVFLYLLSILYQKILR